ncbi:hypothetical protein SAMN05192574_11418 [Mucilaginibacter gossypiicola]|uniref:Uncharacterized protein n=1 Tax=Mucilaginibacter gossypiicola TaxID=551995 RepID=A0A1H8SYC4_9SPHI|nr:hypothetical protein [Mucilaginibacter gossypiicola]SEO83770.1 hypothetical protein SAMN05192574_11418 [Mucilaginibacter gossypiicola]
MNTIISILLKCLFLLLLGSPLVVTAQMTSPGQWVNYDQVFNLKTGLRQYDYDVALIRSSTNTNILWPGEQPGYTIQVVNNLDGPLEVKGKLEIIRYGTKGRPNDVWLPEVVKFATVSSSDLPVSIKTKGFTNIEVKPNIPATFGGYALVLDLGQYGRRLVCSVVRTFAANPKRLQYPKQSLDDMDPDFLQRLGVQAIRMGVDYFPTTDADYQSKLSALYEKLKKYRDRNITVLLMFGAGTAKLPLDMPRALLNDEGVMRKTKQDWVWGPSSDPDFGKFVNRFCVDQGWPKGPVTAVSLWNEPWEGSSISGWQSDILRYREIYKVMADAVLEGRKKGADVLVGGGDSNSNAWDKLFADGKMTFLPIFDFCSIHYQGMETPSIYPEWINRKSPKGRVKIWDTESWVGNTDDRIGLTVATNRSTGYDRSMGIYAGYLSTGGRGSEHFKQKVMTNSGHVMIDRIPDAWSPAVGVGAVQHLIGERDFNRLLFKKGLPWVMLFDGNDHNPDDGTAVVCGDIGEAFGAERLLFRNVRGLKEIEDKERIRKQLNDKSLNTAQKDSLSHLLRITEPLSGGSMVIPADSHFRLYDFYGNLIPPNAGNIQVPLNTQGYYLRSDGSKGSFDRLVKAMEHARISGYEPIEIVAKDMTARIEQTAVLNLQLTNILNRPVSGQLQATLSDFKLSYNKNINIRPHETITVPLQIIKGKANVANVYPLSVRIETPKDGIAVLNEDMHVNTISRIPIKVDGNLDEWQQAIPQTVSSKGTASVSLTEAAWYPFKNFDNRAEGYANGYFAYDDKNFYFAAKVADNTPHPGTYRFENRPDDSFFYPDTAYIMDMDKTLMAREDSVTAIGNDNGALQMPSGNGRIMHFLSSSDVAYAFGIDLDLPAQKYTRVSFYMPNIRVPNATIEVFDGQTGNFLLRRKIDNLWQGAFETLDLTGKVRVVFRTYNWWTSVKVAGIFFDDPADKEVHDKAVFVKEDLDTRGNWKGIYGKNGYNIIGAAAKMPEDVKLSIPEVKVKLPLPWPDGVRHYTYRKNPVTPDNSGLGYSYDNVILAFNVLPAGTDGMLANPPGTMPGYTGYKDTDYEYAMNSVAPEYGGGTEMWRLLTPQLNRKHFFPRQPKSAGEGPVKNSQLVIKRIGNTLITECAIPWSEIPDVHRALESGKKIKLSFRVNDNASPAATMELAKDRSVSKINARAFHPDWKTHWANEVEFGFEK